MFVISLLVFTYIFCISTLFVLCIFFSTLLFSTQSYVLKIKSCYCTSNLFIFTEVQNSIVRLHHNLLAHSAINRHFGLFPGFLLEQKVLFWTFLYLSPGTHSKNDLGVKLLDYIVCTSLTLLGNTKMFTSAVILIFRVTSSV